MYMIITTFVYVYVYIHIYIYVCISYIYIYIYTHVYLYTRARVARTIVALIESYSPQDRSDHYTILYQIRSDNYIYIYYHVLYYIYIYIYIYTIRLYYIRSSGYYTISIRILSIPSEDYPFLSDTIYIYTYIHILSDPTNTPRGLPLPDAGRLELGLLDGRSDRI